MQERKAKSIMQTKIEDVDQPLSSPLAMDFLIDGQISSFCPDQHEADQHEGT